MGLTIDVVLPMLGQPESVPRVLDSLYRSFEDGFTVWPIFVLSPGDDEVRAAVEATGESFIVMAGPPGAGDYARKINTAYRETEGDWLLLGARDLRFHRGWISAATRAGREYEAGVVGTNDLGNPAVMRGVHSTHPLVRRSYVERYGGGWDGPGIVYHEGYYHQYVDTELVAAAQARGMWVFAHDAIVEHLHPLWGKSEMDETYRRALSPGEGKRDARLFSRRSRQYGQRSFAGTAR